MKQIKTIIEPLNAVSDYDKKVNKLLKNGWELKKRIIVNTKGDPNEVGSCGTIQMIYAEFEKEE